MNIPQKSRKLRALASPWVFFLTMINSAHSGTLLNYDNSIPIRNQGKEGLCFAFTGAYLVENFYYRKTEDKITVSPFFLAANAALKLQIKSCGIDGGDVCDTVNASRMKVSLDTGILPDSVHQILFSNPVQFYVQLVGRSAIRENPSPMAPYLVSGGPDLPIIDSFDDVLEEKSKFHKYKKFYVDLGDRFQDGLEESGLRHKINVSFEKWYGAFSRAMYHKPKGYLQDIATSTLGELALLDTNVPSVSLTQMGLSCKENWDQSKMRATIVDNLKLNIPVGISYCSNFLHDSYYSGVASGDYIKNREACKNHASVLVDIDKTGERVLLRNSWGSECREYDKKFSCTNGKVWVPLDELLRNTYATSVVR